MRLFWRAVIGNGSRERSIIGPGIRRGQRAGFAAEYADGGSRGVRAYPDFADRPQESCGVAGVYYPGEDAARIAFFGVYALQHRGQESAGVAAGDGQDIRNRTAMGLVSQALGEDDLRELRGHAAIAHTRYSTTGASRIVNAQPIVARGPGVELALAHNGNVINAAELRDEMERDGFRFGGATDSEVIAHTLANAPASDWGGRASYLMRRLRGAYSLTVLTKSELLGIRDPLGVRPLCVGKLGDGGWMIASESCALDHVGAELVRDVEPGEAILIDERGMRTVKRRADGRRASCVFENIYFARPDSVIDGGLVYSDRVRMGEALADEHPTDADLVIGVPDSATAAAVGYAARSGIPFGEGLVKNRYVGRTFIEPTKRLRDLGARNKYNPLSAVIRGKRLAVVDDSIVRGTTTPRVVSLLRKGGASEVHLRITAPPIISTCHFGVDMATKKELIAANMSVDEIRREVDADSLGFLSVEGLARATSGPKDGFCMGCFTGEYPTPVQLEMDKLVMETREARTAAADC